MIGTVMFWVTPEGDNAELQGAAADGVGHIAGMATELSTQRVANPAVPFGPGYIDGEGCTGNCKLPKVMGEAVGITPGWEISNTFMKDCPGVAS
jgi:hypothetical protein